MQKHLLIDLGHLAHRFLFTNATDIKEIGMGILRYQVLENGIFNYISKFKPDKVYIGVDYKKSWRKDFASFYKENRDEIREKSKDIIDWGKFAVFMEGFIDELRDNFPFIVPKVAHLEADDIIAYFCRTLPYEDEKIIITGDQDYLQLLKYPNTKQYNPIKKQFFENIDPEQELLVKIIIGDKSDNIPNCRKGIGEKKAIKLIESKELEVLLNEVDNDGKPGEFKRNFDRNRTLVDLEISPQNLLDELDNHVKNYKPSNGGTLFKYLIENSLRGMIERYDYYQQVLNKLSK